MKRLALFSRFFWCLHFKKVKPDSCATFVINLRKEVQSRALEQKIYYCWSSRVFGMFYDSPHKQTSVQTTENTVGKGTVIIADRQAPVTQKQKKTDHIDEELRLEIFKTSAIIFLL